MSLEPLFTEAQIQNKVEEMAARIQADYGDEPILLVGVLKGSLYFIADLSRRLGPNTRVDFVQVSSYAGRKESSGVVQIRKDLDINIEDVNVIIVEDIVDTGLTLTHLRELLSTRRPKTLRVASLLSKPDARLHQTQIEYVGFEIPNAFVVGYGLDYAEAFRNLPFVAILSEDA